MNQILFLLHPEECGELSATLELLLHSYLQQSFENGTKPLEAMRKAAPKHYENTRQLITLLQHGNSIDQEAA